MGLPSRTPGVFVVPVPRQPTTQWQKRTVLATELIGRLFFAAAVMFGLADLALGVPVPARVGVIFALSGIALAVLAFVLGAYRWLLDTAIWSVTFGCVAVIGAIVSVALRAHSLDPTRTRVGILAAAGLVAGIIYLRREAKRTYVPPPPPAAMARAELETEVPRTPLAERITLRACTSTYVVLGLMIGGPSGLLGAVGLARHEWGLVVFAVAAIAVLFTWIAAFRIEATADHIVFRQLFSGSTAMPLEALALATIDLGTSDPTRRTKGMYRLVLIPHPDRGCTRMEINIKVFSAAGLTRLMQHVIANARHDARFDLACVDITRGRMPSLFRSPSSRRRAR